MSKQYDPAIATGNWGCGIFKGDKILKFLIQLIAISASSRSGMVYHTFGDPNLQQVLFRLHDLFIKNHATISKLIKLYHLFFKF
jgi:poly(ADP-ribose) glycohydrolase